MWGVVAPTCPASVAMSAVISTRVSTASSERGYRGARLQVLEEAGILHEGPEGALVHVAHRQDDQRRDELFLQHLRARAVLTPICCEPHELVPLLIR